MWKFCFLKFKSLEFNLIDNPQVYLTIIKSKYFFFFFFQIIYPNLIKFCINNYKYLC